MKVELTYRLRNLSERSLTQQKRIYLSLNPGDYSEGVTPVPISNTVVKPFCADGT